MLKRGYLKRWTYEGDIDAETKEMITAVRPFVI